MILHPITLAEGVGIANVFYCAFLWLAGMLIVMYHRAGIQVVGASIACIGFILMLLNSRMFLALSLFFIGFLIHSFGRLLMHLKRRG